MEIEKYQWKMITNRGTLDHCSNIFGYTHLGNNLEVYLPDSYSQGIGLVIAGQHGDEADGTYILSRALRMLHPDQLHCAVVLATNPDGILRGMRGNAYGVDLNRNFPTECWQKSTVYHKWSQNTPQGVKLKSGMRACSEPETSALLSLIEDLMPTWIISIHSPLGCIDDPQLSSLGKWLAAKTKLPLVPEIGYPTPGSLGQWCKENQQPLITLELPDNCYHQENNKIMESLLMLLSKDLSIFYRV